jgi:hypothetical protein
MAFWNEPLVGTYLFLLPKDIRNLIKPLAPVNTYMYKYTPTDCRRVAYAYIFCPMCCEMNSELRLGRACYCDYIFPPIKTCEHFPHYKRIFTYSPKMAKRMTGGDIYRVIFGKEQTPIKIEFDLGN